MKKRFLAIILSLVMVLALWPAAVLAAPANIVINGVDIGYAAGQYFSKDGKACTCHHQNLCEGDIPPCNCLHVAGTAQCYAFALYCEEKMYGCNDKTDDEQFETIGGPIAAGTLNVQNLKELISAAPVGAHIRTNTDRHSMILLSKSEDGFTVVQANGGNSPCQIDTVTYTWEKYVNNTYGRRGIKFVKACTLPEFLNLVVNEGMLHDYDCEKVGNFDKKYVDYEMAVLRLFSQPSCLNISDYGMEFERVYGEAFNKKLPLSSAKWIYQNILNWSDKTWAGMLDYAKSHDGYIGPNKYATISDDGYLCCMEPARGNYGIYVNIVEQRTHGKQIEVVFKGFVSGAPSDPITEGDTYYALVEQKTINGKHYWTVYRTQKLRPGENPLQKLSADPTNDKLSVDGKDAAPAAYKIGGANYFKLRDVAALLNGTSAQFEISYDNDRKAINITTGKAYTPQGYELKQMPTGKAEALTSSDTVYVNGQKLELTAYKIGGANFYGIRDLGRALGFNVGWKQGTGMYIESDKPYSDAD